MQCHDSPFKPTQLDGTQVTQAASRQVVHKLRDRFILDAFHDLVDDRKRDHKPLSRLYRYTKPVRYMKLELGRGQDAVDCLFKFELPDVGESPSGNDLYWGQQVGRISFGVADPVLNTSPLSRPE
jgi:hypothetical protein